MLLSLMRMRLVTAFSECDLSHRAVLGGAEILFYCLHKKEQRYARSQSGMISMIILISVAYMLKNQYFMLLSLIRMQLVAALQILDGLA